MQHHTGVSGRAMIRSNFTLEKPSHSQAILESAELCCLCTLPAVSYLTEKPEWGGMKICPGIECFVKCFCEQRKN